MKTTLFSTILITFILAFQPFYGQDNDSDGLIDAFDLDDDNDGLLDTDECYFNLQIVPVIAPDGLEDGNFGVGYWDAEFFEGHFGIVGSTFGGTSTNNIGNGSNGNPIFRGEAFLGFNSLSFTDARSYLANQSNTSAAVVPANYVGSNWEPTGLTYYQTIFKRVADFSGVITLGGAGFNVDDILELFVNGTRVAFKGNCCGATFPPGTAEFFAINQGDNVEIRYSNFSGKGGYIFNIEFVPECRTDTDGDGTVNSFDADSDGDGCLDALEGSAFFDVTQTSGTQLSGLIQSNGVPSISGGGQGLGYALDSLVNVCTDSDTDDVPDYVDQDDDNDGILDINECRDLTTLVQTIKPDGLEDGNFGIGYWDVEYYEGHLGITGSTFGNTSNPSNGAGIPGSPIYKGEAFLAFNDYELTDARTFINGTSNVTLGSTPESYMGSQDNINSAYYETIFRREYTIGGILQLGGAGFSVDDMSELFINGTRVAFKSDCCGATTNEGLVETFAIVAGDQVELRVTNYGGQGGYILNLQFTPCDDDTDNDNSPDGLDLDSDNDFCPDALEAGHTDPDTDEILGNSPVTVNLMGVVTGQGGYTGTMVQVTDGTASSSTICSILLPVNLIHYNAEMIDDRRVNLNWLVASEQNSDYYSIHRSVDLVNWEFISTVNAVGNSNEELSYETEDLTPHMGTSYYRLTETDVNGVVNNNGIRAVSMNSGFSAQNALLTYPNPTSGVISIISSIVSLDCLELVNSLGQMVPMNIVSAEKGELILDITDFSSGIYFLKCESMRYKIIKK